MDVIVAFDKIGLVLVGPATREAIEIVKTTLERPVLARGTNSKLVKRDQVPLSDKPGGVSRLAQDLCCRLDIRR